MWIDVDMSSIYKVCGLTLYFSKHVSVSTAAAALECINTALADAGIEGCVVSEAPYMEPVMDDTTEIIHLTQRQFEILQCIAQGMSNKEIGRTLDISSETAKVHVKKLLSRLNVKNRTEAACYYYTNINNLRKA